MMEAVFTLPLDNAEDVYTAVNASMRSTDRVNISTAYAEDRVTVEVAADTPALLQGVANSVLRLVKLADKTLTH